MSAMPVSLSEAIFTPSRATGNPFLDAFAGMDPEPKTPGNMPISPPPALPPTLPLSLAHALSPAERAAPPPLLPPFLLAEFGGLSAEGLPAELAALRLSISAALPASPAPPAAPAAFPPALQAGPADFPPPPPALPAEVLCRERGLDLPAAAFAQVAAAAGPADGEPPLHEGGVVRFPPGLSPPAGSPSHGSTLHIAGLCRPCAWFWKPGGCKNGEDCGHCHLCPNGELLSRKKVKQTMMRLGLATPQPKQASSDHVRKLSFNLDEELRPPRKLSASSEHTIGFGSDQESTTIAGSGSDPEGTSSSEQEGPVDREAFLQGVPNAGSALHGSGKCKPCAWFWKPVGCQSDRNCRYCHLCPEGELKNRKKTKTVMMRLGLATPQADRASEQQAKQALSLASLL